MKRILLYRFGRQTVEGLIRQEAYGSGEALEFLTTGGDAQAIPVREIKAICFASEPARPDLFSANTRFERRPKTRGLWARFTMRDGDLLEGLLPLNVIEWPPAGYLLTPPRAGSARQRVYLPRIAVLSVDLLGLIGAARPGAPAKKPDAGKADQLKMFDQ